MITKPRAWVRRAVACGVVACGVGAVAETARTQTPAPQPAVRPAAAAAPAQADDYATRPVAYIYGSVPVTRADLGEFLMARGGADKVELLVNKMIIEYECKKRGITVTDQEMEAALLEDVKGLGQGVTKSDFIKQILPRYGTTFYGWMEDVVRPRLLLSKLCKDKVQVTEDDLKKMFEREFGEKRRVQIVVWPKGDDVKNIDREWPKMRDSQAEFDRVARAQANPALASVMGVVQPISRHAAAHEMLVTQRAFELKPGEISEKILTSQGIVVMKLHEIIPPNPKVNFEAEKERLFKQAYEEKLSEEIPKCFLELKKEARPNVLFTGPAKWRMDTSPPPTAQEILQGVQAAPPTPGAPPLPPPAGNR